eukprot:5117962-Pleurochrysis_carterae.AAC.1
MAVQAPARPPPTPSFLTRQRTRLSTSSTRRESFSARLAYRDHFIRKLHLLYVARRMLHSWLLQY